MYEAAGKAQLELMACESDVGAVRDAVAEIPPSLPVGSLLVAFGDHPPPLPSTIGALDEILTDFIIETCHYAALSASYSRRQKIKADDFKFVLRRDEVLLGRVQEQLWRERKLKEDRKVVDTNEDIKVLAAGQLDEEAEMAGGKKTKRGRKKKAEDGEGREAKRRKSG